MFKIGDKVRVIEDSCGHRQDIGKILTVRLVGIDNILVNEVSFFLMFSDVELLEPKKNIMSTIKEKFVLAFLGEPEKSFRRAEITNGDGFLTTEGQGVFLAWLLKTNGDAFKTAVVDDLLKSLDDCKGCDKTCK